MRFILFFADVLLTNKLCDKLINKTFYNMAHLWRVLFVIHGHITQFVCPEGYSMKCM